MGIAHGLFVFTGDILLLYAILGAFLWRRRNAPVAQLVASAKRWFVFAIPTMLVMTLLIQTVSNDLPDEFWDDRLGGTYMQVLSYRWENWFYTFLTALIFQGPLVFVAFLIGLVAAKTNFFENNSLGLVLLRRWLPYLALTALPINLLYGLHTSGLWVPNPALQVAIGTATAIGAPALSALYLYGVVLLVQRFALPEWVYRAGRNTLSCYVLQGVLGGLCFAGYGLGLFGQLGHAQILLASLLIALSSMLLVSIWAKYLGRGPLEPLLRGIK
ncbi:DUF418 domain-containing protein [Gilvimarinus sp. SDUM040013]|uniref:DUF418 domain-containing protein n=2 Tax=Gilvimarinus gilvus TaxID=3058038 RepID=A0ABU4RWT3_9GAMM|nr:DUF418 domain-containing protein [Gilvimarinus sp. SDUM040013]MDX6848706.1 DUF418 domain-containing protein [Gilvimarinus sp. SDUM040013]